MITFTKAQRGYAKDCWVLQKVAEEGEEGEEEDKDKDDKVSLAPLDFDYNICRSSINIMKSI